MKHFLLALLLVVNIYAFKDHEGNTHRFTHVTGTEMIDGYNPGVNADVIVDILKVRDAINCLIHGKKQGAVVQKKHLYKDTPVTLEDLILIFENLEMRGVDHNNPEYQAAQDCLDMMIADFMQFSDDFLAKEAQFIQKIIIKIIHSWSHKSGRHNSLLLQWGAVDEKALFKKISAPELGQFCIDLKNFLYDLMFSCPKAREQFKNKYITEARYGDKYTEKRAAFDHSFQAH